MKTPAQGLVLVLELLVTKKMRDRVLGASFCVIACGAAYWALSDADATTGVQMYQMYQTDSYEAAQPQYEAAAAQQQFLQTVASEDEACVDE